MALYVTMVPNWTGKPVKEQNVSTPVGEKSVNVTPNAAKVKRILGSFSMPERAKKSSEKVGQKFEICLVSQKYGHFGNEIVKHRAIFKHI